MVCMGYTPTGPHVHTLSSGTEQGLLWGSPMLDGHLLWAGPEHEHHRWCGLVLTLPCGMAATSFHPLQLWRTKG